LRFLNLTILFPAIWKLTGRVKIIATRSGPPAGLANARSTSLVNGGAIFVANLANLGDYRWPASPGYNNLMDICQELCEEKKLSEAELNAIFIPDYFATPHEMSCLRDEDTQTTKT
jgi:hypothetical protein